MLSAMPLASLLFAAAALQGAVSGPVEYISRAEIATSLVLARMNDVPEIDDARRFADIHPGSPHEPFLLYAERVGMIDADEDDRLRPDASVSRAEFLKMLSIAFDVPADSPHGFSDVPDEAWFEPYAGIARRYRFLRLRRADLLEPRRAVTRQEALRAMEVFTDILRTRSAAAMPEQSRAREHSWAMPRLYTVMSTRRERARLAIPQWSAGHAAPASVPSYLSDVRTQILSMVNAARLKEGLHALTYSALLEQSAQGYADRMAEQGFFGHVSPDGGTLKERIGKTGYYDRRFSQDCTCVKGYALGENLARGQKTPEEAVDAWMESPTHRAAILKPDYTHIGIGVNAGIWVQHFGGVLLPGGEGEQ